MFLFFMLLIAVVSPNDLLVVLAPVISWAASLAANWLKSKISGLDGIDGTLFISVVVPAASLLAAYLTQLIVPDLNFWIIFLISLASVFLNQFIKQWTQTATNQQTPVLPNITTVEKKP